ncbi:MAG TPA: hypothetical protein PLJ44_00010 [Victivallales bacterium]|nr:hypothetical protein [Victivallales bacterium]
MKHQIGTTALILTILLSLTIRAEYYCGEVRYDAKKNINPEQGTFETWFRLDANPNTFSIASSSRRMLVFMLVCDAPDSGNSSSGKGKGKDRKSAGQEYFNFKYANHKENLAIRTNIADTLIKPLSCHQGKDISLNMNEWHYVALTWKFNGSECCLQIYLDGKLIKSHTEKIDFPTFSDNTIIKIGDAQTDYSEKDDDGKDKNNIRNSGGIGAIDCFRISKTVRTPDEIKSAFENGLKEDENTLLFDNFENVLIKKKNWSKNDLLKSQLEESGKSNPTKKVQGIVYGPCEIVKGKFGKAIKLFIEKN